MKKTILKVKKYLKVFGPGVITGAADDDPSGIATYTQTGAKFGYGQLWTVVVMLPLMTAIQGSLRSDWSCNWSRVGSCNQS